MADQPSTDSGQGARLLRGVLRRILRPLVRLLVERQVTYPQLAQLLKGLYVEVADAEFRIEGRRETLSRLSLLTGIHRKEVKRLREQREAEQALPRSIALGAQVLARWSSGEPWCDAGGRPRPLPRDAAAEGELSFDALVRGVSVDIHPRSVLDEWLRLGVADIDEQQRVRLVSAGFVPTRGFEEKAHFIGRNLRDHIAAACENLNTEPSPFLERSVFYASLPEEVLGELSALAREEGQRALERVNALARRARDGAAPGGRRRRMTFGVYFYETESDAERASEAESARG